MASYTRFRQIHSSRYLLDGISTTPRTKGVAALLFKWTDNGIDQAFFVRTYAKLLVCNICSPVKSNQLMVSNIQASWRVWPRPDLISAIHQGPTDALCLLLGPGKAALSVLSCWGGKGEPLGLRSQLKTFLWFVSHHLLILLPDMPRHICRSDTVAKK